MGIHAIIWDIGGVLVRTTDPEPRNQLAARYGLGRQEINDLVFGSEGNYQAQLGEVSHEEHWTAIQAQLGLTAEETKAFHAQFFAGDIVDYKLVEYIRGLRQDRHTAVLSNALSDLRGLLTGEWGIDDAFNTLIISAEVGLMKPDPAIYELTLEKIGFEAKESVFIDDMPENIEAAKEVGLHGIRFESPAQAVAELEKLLK